MPDRLAGAAGRWHGALIEAYGVTPDATRLAYYRELWNAT